MHLHFIIYTMVKMLTYVAIGDHPNLNLTPEEKQLFARLYKQADTKGDGIVTGEVAVSLFPKAKLSENTLGEIWAMADTENRGFLLQEDFAKAMRLIGHFQSNSGQPLSTDLALRPCPPGFPKFEGINMGPGAPVNSGSAFDHAGTSPAIAHPPQGFPPSQSIQAQNSGSVRVPPLTPDRVADYTRLFDSAGVKPGGTLDGMLHMCDLTDTLANS
jgi:epidermal growth factor receptor substrate 15